MAKPTNAELAKQASVAKRRAVAAAAKVKTAKETADYRKAEAEALADKLPSSYKWDAGAGQYSS